MQNGFVKFFNSYFIFSILKFKITLFMKAPILNVGDNNNNANIASQTQTVSVYLSMSNKTTNGKIM